MSDIKWQHELNEYIKQSEPEYTVKSKNWETAIGLQDVDGLKISEYLLENAKKHIEGEITIEDVKDRIDGYYNQKDYRRNLEESTEEADKVAVRIAEILNEKTFQFSPIELSHIHKRLFSDVYKHAGEFRKYNITKKEWILNGDTVLYSDFETIKDTLNYDFELEKEFKYKSINYQQAIKHIAKFTSGIWQIHPFAEGNTRTVAVFIIKYLQSFGYDVGNEIFATNSWYFRNALVRANYNNIKKGIASTTEYLEMFFENLLLNSENDLKNRYLHIDYIENIQSANNEVSKCKNCTLNCTLEELAIIKEIENKPTITQKDLAKVMGVSERTIKSRTVLMQEKGLIARENGKRNGRWTVLIDIEVSEQVIDNSDIDLSL